MGLQYEYRAHSNCQLELTLILILHDLKLVGMSKYFNVHCIKVGIFFMAGPSPVPIGEFPGPARFVKKRSSGSVDFGDILEVLITKQTNKQKLVDYKPGNSLCPMGEEV